MTVDRVVSPADPDAMRVAIVFSIGGLGGAERSLTRMSAASEARDVHYQLGTLGGEGDWTDWLKSQGWRGTAHDVSIFKPWSLVRFVRAMRRDSPDVVYAVGARVFILVSLLRWLLPPLKLVQAIRATYPDGSTAGRRYALAERLFPRADAYIANSRAGAISYARITGVDAGSIRVIFNGVDVPERMPPPERRIPRQVLIVANLQPRKEHIDFLEVAREVLRSCPDASFVFVGRDDMNGAVQARAREMGLDGCVKFPGYCADVSEYLSRASLFVLPSRYQEGAPTSILEAQAHGLPVVAYESGGVGEIVRNGIDGVVIEEMTNANMAREIVALMRDDARRVAMGGAGREKVANNHTLRACAALHAEVWRELCKR